MPNWLRRSATRRWVAATRTVPGNLRPLLRLRGNHAAADQDAVDRGHRRSSLSTPLKMVGDRLSAALDRQGFTRQDDRLLDRQGHSARAGVRPRRAFHQPGRSFCLKPSPILVQRLSGDVELATQRRHVQPNSTGEDGQQLRFHRHHQSRHASSIWRLRCQRCPATGLSAINR